jgi:hypothetical protein
MCLVKERCWSFITWQGIAERDRRTALSTKARLRHEFSATLSTG